MATAALTGHSARLTLQSFTSLGADDTQDPGSGMLGAFGHFILKPVKPKVTVEVCVIFLKLGEIDTLKEQFSADVLVKAKWREPELDRKGKNKDELIDEDEIDFEKYWNPKLFVENTVGDPKEVRWRTLAFSSEGDAFICENQRLKGTFVENLELNDFPFDVQDLTVTVTSERPASELNLIEDRMELHRVYKQSFIDEQEWSLYKHLESESKFLAEPHGDPSVKRVLLSVKCRAARRPWFFVWNIFLVTFLFCSLSFATFSVEYNLPQNRLQLSFTLVLTAVAFKFVINQSLPRVSYLTYLDKYLLGSMCQLAIVCAWHSIVAKIDSKHDAKVAELVFLTALAVIYIGFNAGICFHIYAFACKRRRIMKQKDREYMESVARHQLSKQYSSSSASGGHAIHPPDITANSHNRTPPGGAKHPSFV